jgi:ELWxxDGT repeat protein
MHLIQRIFRFVRYFKSQLVSASEPIRREVLIGGVLLLGSFTVSPLQAQPELVGDHITGDLEMGDSIVITEGGTTKLCFLNGTAFDGVELFCYDGSSVTQRTNIGGVPESSPPAGPDDLTFYDGAFYFEAIDTDYNQELWSYDGTSASPLSDVVPYPAEFTVYDGTLYFQADGDDGEELWSYDGSSATQVADINSGSGDSSPSDLTVYDGTLYFQADGDDGVELWSYDGSTASQAADINSGSGDSSPSDLTVYDGTLHFQADGGSDGMELWSYDGSTASQAADINSGSGDSSPSDLTVYDGTLHFQADGGSDGMELWSYDGSTASQAADINSGSGDSSPSNLTSYNVALYFQADGGSDGIELWSYDGSSASQVGDLNPGSCETTFGGTEPCSSAPSNLTVYRNTLYFNADGIEGIASYDGSSINETPFTNNTENRPEEKAVYDGSIYFRMETDSTGNELWSYDGSSISQVADINPGGSSSTPKYLTVYDGTLYFQADGGSDGAELWSYDGSGVSQVANIWDTSFNNGSDPKYLTVYDGTLYFQAQDGTTSPLWSYDGSYLQKAADTGGEMTVYDGSLYVAYGALYRYDGSSLTQVNSTEINPVANLTVYDGSLYFLGRTDSDGEELWSYDGSEVSQVADINSGSSDSSPSDLAVYDGVLYFRAIGGSDGEELWSYDASSISQVEDINPGSSSSTPTDLTAFGNKLYFVAKNGSDGWEPHAYTGGENVNSLDFAPSGVSAGGFDPVVYDEGSGSKLYVTATNGSTGFELYRIGPNDPLPVELAGFNATLSEEEVHLSWTTASETGNAGFHIQRRTGEGAKEREGAWTTVGTVEGSGTTSQAQSYRFTDADLPYEADKLTYRLKQVDTDGTENFSDEIVVERGVTEVELLGTYPNPARSQATVRYALPDKQEATIRLYDVLGRQVRTVVSGEQEGRHEQRLDTSRLSSGVYFLRLEAGGQTRTQKFTVTR